MVITHELYRFYFGKEGDPQITTQTCNVCSIDVSHWSGRKERHIEFHEQLKPADTSKAGAHVLTDAGFHRDLTEEWLPSECARVAWSLRADRTATMRRLLLTAIIAIPAAYVLALIFIVPPTTEARAVASVLFAFGGIITATYGYIFWRTR